MSEKKGITLEHLVADLNPSFETGLTSQLAADLLKKFGRNILVPKKARVKSSYLAFLKEPMVWLLALAAIVYWFLGDKLDSLITGIAVIPVGLIDVIVDLRTDRALRLLEALKEPRVSVVRDGQTSKIPSEELVPGDHLVVKEGEIMMADAAIMDSSDLRVDEAALTGESVPLEKSVQILYSQEFFGNKGSLFAGTRVLMGRATCIVTKTGQETTFGRIGGILAKTESARTKLQLDIRWVVTRFGAAAVGLSGLLILLDLLLGSPLSQAILSGVSLAIAAIPEELPVVFTLFLSLGMLELANNKALVRRLPAVEALGSVNVVCTDKTGTLTTGTMSVVEVYTDQAHSAKEFLQIDLSSRFLLYALMACEQDPFDYMEQAIYRFSAQTEAMKELAKCSLEREYPFDERRKLMSHIWRGPRQELILSAKGAVESILSLCKMDESQRKELLSVNHRLGSTGIRLLALAYKTLARMTSREQDERGLTFAGLIGFSDPLREGAAKAVAQAQAAGVRVVMLTGDHKSTADSIAHQVGLKHDIVIEGSELDTMGEFQFREAIKNHNIFCRILPEQKLRIVDGLQKLGYSVAVTGDGINDAPALKKADIGIAMGERGTDVAKEAASMILLDDNFNTIVSSIKNGRKIYDNLQNAFNYIVAFHLPIFLAALIVPLLRLPLLLVPIDIVLLELVLHPVVSISFQAQPAKVDVMLRGPRERSEPIMNSKELARLIAIGAMIFLFSLGSYAWSYSSGEPENIARGLALATMVVGQTFIMPAELGGGERRLAKTVTGNRYLLPTILLVLASLLAILYVPFLAEALKVGPVGLLGWGIVSFSGLSTFAFAALTKKNRTRSRWNSSV